MEKVIIASKNSLRNRFKKMGYSFHEGCIIIKYDQDYVYIINGSKEKVRDKYLDSEWKQFKGYKYFYGIKYYKIVDLVKTLSLLIDEEVIVDDDYGHVMKIEDLYAKITGVRK